MCRYDPVALSEKADLWSRSGADAVDMESDAFRAMGAETKVAWAVVRAVSDPAERDLPLDFNRFLGRDHHVRLGKLAAYLAFRSAALFRTIQFRRELHWAAENLGRVLSRLPCA